jgi:hypothetical protein
MPTAANRVPEHDIDVHLVLDDFGPAGRAYREADLPPVFEDVISKNLVTRDQLALTSAVSFDTVVEDLLSGQYNSPVLVIAFNIAEGWARDVSEDAAREVAKRHHERGTDLDRGLRRFLASFADDNTLTPADE